MLSKELFVKFINNYKTFDSAFERIEEAIYGKKYYSNLYEFDFYEAVGGMLDNFLDSHFTLEGSELVSWWLFEDVEKIIYEKAKETEFFDEFKEDKEVSVETIDELWDYMEKHRADYFLL